MGNKKYLGVAYVMLISEVRELLKKYKEEDLRLLVGVKPREVLQKTYKYIQENDKLPEYFLY